jgi:hypothetical protein
MFTFRTFIIVDLQTAHALELLKYPSAWHLRVFDDPSCRHWQDKNGKGSSTNMGKGRGTSPNGMILAKEIILVAESQIIADNVFSLIYSSSLLAYPDKYRIEATSGIMIVTDSHDLLLEAGSLDLEFTRNEYLYIGVLILLKAWKKPELLYSIEKFAISLDLDSVSPHSVNPVYGKVFDNYDPSYHYHVIASYAVICAFSVLEEIGLEIRSSSKNPRFIKNDGEEIWNPVVYQETEKRLKEIGLSASYQFHWVERGEETEVQKHVKPKFGVRIYLNDPELRDTNMELIEAIHRCSYIRNFIASHKFKTQTQFISPYDVHNVQTVSRVLLINRLGLWPNLLNWRNDITNLHALIL